MVTKLIVTRYSGVVNSNYKILFSVFGNLYENMRKIKGLERKKFGRKKVEAASLQEDAKSFEKIKNIVE